MGTTGVGIDVSKASLDVGVHGSRQSRRFSNDRSGWVRLQGWLTEQGLAQSPVVLEATGGYERGVADALYAAGMKVIRINPRQGRDFAKACGQLAKTDQLDARVLAHVAASMDLPCYQPRSAQEQRLAEWTERRRQVLQMLVAERQRARLITDRQLGAMVRRSVAGCERALAALDKQIAEQLAAQPRYACLRSLKGVGPVAQATLIGHLPELGQLSGKAIAKLVGVAPLAQDSGLRRGQRHVWGGRATVRQVLYMVALTAMRHEPVLRTFYQSLRTRGKPAKVAIVAVMRKIVVILNARMRDQAKLMAAPA